MSWEIDLFELQWRHFTMGMELAFLAASVAWRVASLSGRPQPKRRFLLIQGDKQ